MEVYIPVYILYVFQHVSPQKLEQVSQSCEGILGVDTVNFTALILLYSQAQYITWGMYEGLEMWLQEVISIYLGCALHRDRDTLTQ